MKRTIYTDRNPYARETESDGLANHIRARRFDWSMHGRDPDGIDLEKPEELPWAVVPLVIAGKLYGQIAADCVRSRKPITDVMLEHMTILGEVAAFVVASDEIVKVRTRVAEDRLLEDAVHSLKLPAHNIHNLVDTLLNVGDSLHDRDEWLRMLYSQTDRLRHLVENATDLRRIRLRPSEQTAVSLRNLVREVVNDFRLTAQKHGVIVEYSENSQPCEVDGNREDLRIVMDNLLENAAKFSGKGQKIRVGVASDREAYLVSVLDEGPGVPPDQRETIFGEFVSIARDKVPQGSGLGLCLAHEIIQQHGGTITCHAGLNGRGAELRFTLKRKLD